MSSGSKDPLRAERCEYGLAREVAWKMKGEWVVEELTLRAMAVRDE